MPLPCLRFFLRSDRDIRAAYIPSLQNWMETQQQQQQADDEQQQEEEHEEEL
jgi:hypothetical protein